MFASSAETVHVGVSASAVHPRTTEQAQRLDQIKQQLGSPVIVPGLVRPADRATEFRINRIQRRLRDIVALDAIDFWDDDQRLAAEKLTLEIKKRTVHAGFRGGNRFDLKLIPNIATRLIESGQFLAFWAVIHASEFEAFRDVLATTPKSIMSRNKYLGTVEDPVRGGSGRDDPRLAVCRWRRG